MGKLLSLGRNGHEGEQDFELNLASIIDCFTVLITYLLVSASFLTIGMFDVAVPSIGPTSNNANPPPKVTMSVKLLQNGALRIKVTGAGKASANLAAKNGTWDFEALGAQTEGYRSKWSGMDTAMVAADPEVEYSALVKGIDRLKKTLKFVFIGEQ